LTLGGDSIHAVRIVNQLRPIYGERIGVTSMFEHPTIRALSQTLELDKLADRSTR
jgi:aryl carrier-like protein